MFDELTSNGYKVIYFSKYKNRIVRILDSIYNLVFKYFRYDVLILQVYGNFSFYFEDFISLISKLSGKKIIYTIHGGSFGEFFDKNRNWVTRVLKRADVITTPSDFLRIILEKRGFTSTVIPNIINFKEYHFKIRDTFKPNILWMRTFHPVYNPLMALKTLQILLKKMKDAHLYMAGFDAGYKEEIRSYIEKNKLENSVTLMGVILGNEKQEIANKCDIYINTNNIDNTPVSLIEMGAFGIPIITTNVGGITYMYNNMETAFLVDPNDSEKMAEYIEYIINNNSDVKKIVENSYNYIKIYDSENVLKMWEDLLIKIFKN
ncbi:MAG TPA: glycosyltransferase family 4 protein [Ignavibacteria bacterium]|nr:glycosyltransferase family 4 protein [Ignavibacteria bacterium]